MEEKWEYKIATWLPSDGSFESWLNANGGLGWELVQITNKITSADITCIFKRKIQKT